MSSRCRRQWLHWPRRRNFGTASARLALAVNFDRSNYGSVCNGKKTTPRKQTRHHNQSQADFSGRRGTVGQWEENGETQKNVCGAAAKAPNTPNKLKAHAASGHEVAQTFKTTIKTPAAPGQKFKTHQHIKSVCGVEGRSPAPARTPRSGRVLPHRRQG